MSDAPSLFDVSSTYPYDAIDESNSFRPTCPPHHHICSAEHHTNILEVRCTRVSSTGDGRVVEVVGMEWRLQKVSDLQLTV